MDTLIKNVNEEDWHFLKVEAARKKVTMGKLFNKLIVEYQQKEQETPIKKWNQIFSREPLLTKAEARELHKATEEFRKEFSFEG